MKNKPKSKYALLIFIGFISISSAIGVVMGNQVIKYTDREHRALEKYLSEYAVAAAVKNERVTLEYAEKKWPLLDFERVKILAGMIK